MSWLDTVRRILQGQLDAAGGTLDAIMPLLIPLLIFTIASSFLRFLDAEVSGSEERAEQIKRAGRIAAFLQQGPTPGRNALEPTVARRLARVRERLRLGPPK